MPKKNKYIKRSKIIEAKFRELIKYFSLDLEAQKFGAKRIKGKRGRGASGKIPVFGILQRGGKVYTEIVPDCAKSTLQAVIRGRVSPESVIHSDY